MIKFLLWLLLLVVCWPLAILALLLWPLVWLISLPFRLLGIAVDGVFSLLRAMVMLPARVLGGGRALVRGAVSTSLPGLHCPETPAKGRRPSWRRAPRLRGLDFDATRFGLGDLGDRQLETPSLNEALMASACTFSGNVKLRTNLPSTLHARIAALVVALLELARAAQVKGRPCRW